MTNLCNTDVCSQIKMFIQARKIHSIHLSLAIASLGVSNTKFDSTCISLIHAFTFHALREFRCLSFIKHSCIDMEA